MITIIYEAHSTSLDNENHLSSGQFDVALSPLGEKQAKELGERYKDQILSTGSRVGHTKFDSGV